MAGETGDAVTWAGHETSRCGSPDALYASPVRCLAESFALGAHLVEVDYVYVRADGIHLNVRLEEAKACVLVLVGVPADGSKELVALKDGYRESAESWADLTRESAQQQWRAVNAPHLVALARAGARFERGRLVERPEAVAA